MRATRAACCGTSPGSAGTEHAAAIPDRRLIINADDFGLSPGINAGILEAVRAGIVTSLSVMVNTPSFDDGLRALRGVTPAPSVGLHLNLTAGPPVSPPETVPSLVDAGGRFHRIARLAGRSMAGLVLGADVERETAAQLARLCSAWPVVSHLDSHQHAHALPAIWRAVRRGRGVRVVRAPDEPAMLRGRPGRLKRLALRAIWRLGSAGDAGTAPGVRGIGMHGDRGYLAELLRIVDDLPPGLTELIAHPGRADASVLALDPYDAPRERELAALLSGELRARLERNGVMLARFPQEAALTP